MIEVPAYTTYEVFSLFHLSVQKYKDFKYLKFVHKDKDL
jgi:hypothetical protein